MFKKVNLNKLTWPLRLWPICSTWKVMK